jgi:hypothetical protein
VCVENPKNGTTNPKYKDIGNKERSLQVIGPSTCNELLAGWRCFFTAQDVLFSLHLSGENHKNDLT